MSRLSPAKQSAIQTARAETAGTRRPTSGGAEAALHHPFEVLDHGLVRLVDYMGDDRSIPQAARVSYGRGTHSVSSDAGLIRYLMRHRHTTPFEMVQAKFHIVLPLFVARQWMRHRAGTFNEYSARYSVLDKEFYTPAPDALAAQSQANKQGRAGVLAGAEADRALAILRQDAATTYDHYLELIGEDENDDPDGRADTAGERQGLARELARINLPVGIYTQFYWSVNLWNLMHFLKLRQDPHAQYEIRAYADTIAETILAHWVPIAHRAFEDFHRHAVSLSAQGHAVVNAALARAADAAPAAAPVDPAAYGVAGRELHELKASFPAIEAHLTP